MLLALLAEAMLLALLLPVAAAVARAEDVTCVGPPNMYAIFQDMHDGDQKCTFTTGGYNPTICIKPYNNSESWETKLYFNTTRCSGMVDFRVPGKPNPPPIPLTLTYLDGKLASYDKRPDVKILAFNDFTGSLGPPATPLNMWIMTKATTQMLC